jgi:putative transposase
MRSLIRTFCLTQIAVPRAEIIEKDGKTTQWKSKSLEAYQRRTRAANVLIALTYLSGTNTRRVRRALAALFGAPLGRTRLAASGVR